MSERVLVVMAHPDDVDFWSLGTVMKLLRGGARVTYLLVTDGSAGGFDPAAHSRVGFQRRLEQTEAARIAGVADVRWLDDYQDGQVTVESRVLRDITRVVRQVRPQVVIAQSPTRNWDDMRLSHPDHLAVGEAVSQVVYPLARNPFAFPELLDVERLDAWTVPTMFLQGDPQPNLVVDVTDTFPQREDALMAHVSQHPDPQAARAQLRQQLGQVAEAAGLAAGSYAECFRKVVLPA